MIRIIFISILFASGALADYYVRDGGSGSGTNWSDAADQVPSSSSYTRSVSTIWVADGSYSGFTLDELESGTTRITIKKATVASHGTSTGWSDAYGDGVATINGNIVIMTDDWTVDGVSGGGPAGWTSGHGFVINGEVSINPSYNPIYTWASGQHGNDVEILHCKIVGTANGSSGTDAVHADFCDNLRVAYCWTVDTDNCPLHTFQITDPVIEYNYIDFFAAGEDPEVHGEIWSCDNQDGNYIGATFRYNVVRWCHSTGGLMFAGTDVAVYGNVFYRDPDYIGGTDWVGNHGVIGGWNNSASQWRNVLVYNNTFIGVSQSAPRPLGALAPSGGNSGCVANNNLFYACGTEGYGLYTNNGENTWTGTDPFVDFEALNFALEANTTAGENLGSPYNVDMLGNTRTTWTRGAVEFQSVGAAIQTLNVTNLIGTGP